MGQRAKALLGVRPQLVARLILYPVGQSSRRGPLRPGFGCPCFPSTDQGDQGWDCWLLLGDREMQLGTTRDVGFVFLSGDEAVNHLKSWPRFYLRETGFIGEAVPLELDPDGWQPSLD